MTTDIEPRGSKPQARPLRLLILGFWLIVGALLAVRIAIGIAPLG